MDRPPTPLFIPTKTGVDAETQIAEGDLFDFDFEVEPILEVLVGKTLEQGLMEVMEEEELAAMRAHQEHFEQVRNAELVATQRMEAAEKRKLEEKERRLAQEKKRVQREREVKHKVAAQNFSRGFLTGLIGSVFDRLYEQGHFYDPVEREVLEQFMPWVKEAAAEQLKKEEVARDAAKQIVARALALAKKQREEAEARRQKEAAEALKRKEVAAAKKAAVDAAREQATKERANFLIRILTEQGTVSSEQMAEATEELQGEVQAQLDEIEAARQAKIDEIKAAREEEIAEKRAQWEAEDHEEEFEEPPEEPIEIPDDGAKDKVPNLENPDVLHPMLLAKLLEKEMLTNEQIVQALGMDQLGDMAYFRRKDPEEEPAPTSPPAS
eukprot:jgi/Mesvir1/26354/Mv22526-RA.1